jgi:hypothetical protein
MRRKDIRSSNSKAYRNAHLSLSLSLGFKDETDNIEGK